MPEVILTEAEPLLFPQVVFPGEMEIPRPPVDFTVSVLMAEHPLASETVTL